MTNQTRITVVVPVWNQLEYTRLCLESLRRSTDSDVEIIIVDNGSTDGTHDYLAAQPDIRLISNSTNLGCAAAWNLGVRAAADSEWIIILNNDVLLSAGWLNGLRNSAAEWNLDIVSPAFREGHDQYDFERYACEYVTTMSSVLRSGVAQGLCFMVNRKVFDTIGLFDENFRIGQFEDADFFRRAKAAGFHLATTGSSFIHHFGSVTQDSIRKKGPSTYEAENRAYYRKKWKLNWFNRFILRQKNKILHLFWSRRELSTFGHTLKERFENGRLYYY